MKMLQKLKDDRIVAMKAKDTVAKNCLVFLLSEAQKIAKADNREVTDSDVIQAAKSWVKKNQQTIDAANDALPDIEREIRILKEFLPEQYSDDKLHSIIDEIVKAIPEDQRSPKMIGRVMGQLSSHGDSVDRSKASVYIKSLI
jgi:uncharacterized protein YqeY